MNEMARMRKEEVVCLRERLAKWEEWRSGEMK